MSRSRRVKFEVLSPLKQYVEDSKSIEAEGSTVREALDNLTMRFPKLGAQIFSAESGTVRDFVTIFLNGEDIRNLSGVDSKVNPNDKIIIMPAIAGGSA